MDKRSTKTQTVETMCEKAYIQQNRRKQQTHKNQQFELSFNDQTCVLLMYKRRLTSVYNVHLKRWFWSWTNIKRTRDRSILTKARFTSYPLRLFRRRERQLRFSVCVSWSVRMVFLLFEVGCSHSELFHLIWVWLQIHCSETRQCIVLC